MARKLLGDPLYDSDDVSGECEIKCAKKEYHFIDGEIIESIPVEDFAEERTGAVRKEKQNVWRFFRKLWCCRGDSTDAR